MGQVALTHQGCFVFTENNFITHETPTAVELPVDRNCGSVFFFFFWWCFSHMLLRVLIFGLDMIKMVCKPKMVGKPEHLLVFCGPVLQNTACHRMKVSEPEISDPHRLCAGKAARALFHRTTRSSPWTISSQASLCLSEEQWGASSQRLWRGSCMQ